MINWGFGIARVGQESFSLNVSVVNKSFLVSFLPDTTNNGRAIPKTSNKQHCRISQLTWYYSVEFDTQY